MPKCFLIFTTLTLVLAGFQNPAIADSEFMRGDANFDHSINIGDAIYSLSYQFIGGENPVCLDSADADDSGGINIADPIFLLNYLFLGGITPPMPFPQFGADSTPDQLPCEACVQDSFVIFPDNSNIFCDCEWKNQYGAGRTEICGNNYDENCDFLELFCANAPGDPQKIGTVNSNYSEWSGIVASRQYPGVYWVHLDSDNPYQIFAIRDNGTLIASFALSENFPANSDWEDIAIDENNFLWIADFGNNPANGVPPRTQLTIYKFPEPNPFILPTESIVPTAYAFQYPDGNHNAESLIVWDGEVYIIEKIVNSEPTSGVYKFPEMNSHQVTTLIKIADLPTQGGQVTAADISQDGMRLAVITDNTNMHWIIERNFNSSVDDFFNNCLDKWEVSFENEKGEGVAFIPGTYDIYITSEQKSIWSMPSSLYELQRVNCH